jgi:hypothetical protein
MQMSVQKSEFQHKLKTVSAEQAEYEKKSGVINTDQWRSDGHHVSTQAEFERNRVEVEGFQAGYLVPLPTMSKERSCTNTETNGTLRASTLFLNRMP